MEAEIRKLTRRGHGDDSDEERAKKKPKKSALEEEMSKYTKGRGLHKKGKRKDEGDILDALNSFRDKLKSTTLDIDDVPDDPMDTEEGAVKAAGEEDSGMEVDKDTGFLSHLLHFPKDNSEEVVKAERDYEVIDPRQRGAQAKEEERERKKALKPKDGGRGYRR